MEFYFLCFVFLVIFWNFCKYGFPTRQTGRKEPETELDPEPEPEPEPEPRKPKLRLLRLPMVAFKECMLSMDFYDLINLSLCSKYTTNTIKHFKKSYFKEITNCEIEFSENYGYLGFSTPKYRIKYFFSDTVREKDAISHGGLFCYIFSHNPLDVTQRLAKQLLEISDCGQVEINLRTTTALEEFVSWGNNYESSIKSVYCFANIGGTTIFDLLKYFKTWKRLVLIHIFANYHFNQTDQNKSISIMNWDQGLLNSFWKLPHQSIHLSKNVFKMDQFIGYLQKWIESSIPCTELVDFTAELHLPNYFDSTLRSVKFEVIDEEWSHPIHGTIPPPSYKIQRRDQKKNALLFTFDKDGELWLGMHIY